MKITAYNMPSGKREVRSGFALNACTLMISVLCSPVVFGEDYYFDPNLLQGSGYGQNLERFNEKEVQISAGESVLDVYVNGQLISANEKIIFKANDKGKTVPCLSGALIEQASIRLKTHESAVANPCLFLTQTGQNINYDVDMEKLRLNLIVPQEALLRNPRGYIPVSEWESGDPLALFLRHNTNFYHTENTSNHYKYSYLWSGINTGTNLGLWQVRHQGNLRYVDSNISGSSYKYNAVRTWVQRPIPVIDSVVSVGDNYTSNSLFGSLSFNGLKLATDQRMWPQGKRGYAPDVRGVASTTARVVVRQQGKVIYETTVSPGNFVINDLYNTRDRGDLQVDVIEASGRVSTFTVPYSSVPDSVRPGNWDYSLSLGRVRHYYRVDNNFIEGVLQRGVNNTVTANTGVRLAQNYQAGLLGGVIATQAGAFGLNTIYSHAKVENDRTESGWQVEASYSKTFTTGTNLVLAAYRYSTSGYRDLQDVLGVRRQDKDGTQYWSDTLKQRNRFSATISQPMDTWGTLNLTGSTTDYYDDRSHVNQLQLGYSNSWRNISYNISMARQYTVWSNDRYYASVNDSDYDTSNRSKHTENTVSLGISVPLDWGKSRSNLTFDMNKSNDTQSALVGMNGSAGERGNLTYALYTGAENYRDGGNAVNWGGSVQQNTPVGAFQGSVAAGKDFRQFGLGTSGTFVLHRGGITAGPYASDTFALIHAPGAQGAVVNNGQGATIDRFGYAILPSLTPYRYNDISLDSKNISDDVELQGGSQRVVPYAGAISRLDFKTLSGRAVLITTSRPQGGTLPLGADVLDRDNQSIGMVGQAGQIYARLAATSGVLYVTWGKGKTQSCRIDYQLPGAKSEGFTQLNLPCVQE